MFRFANSSFLYLFLLLPFLIILYIIVRRVQNNAIKKFSEEQFLSVLMPLRSKVRNLIKFVLFLLILSCLIVALARPQFGSKLEQVKRKGIEIIIALDVSRSMMAEDIKPNRLERAKQAITSLINRMSQDKIGIIVFAGDAYTQLPITSDFISAKIFLSNINTEIVSKQGTAIASAIDLGVKSFTQDAEPSKVIIIISDGENHEGDAIQAAQNAASKGIKVYTIGMGSLQGSPVPNSSGQFRSGFLKDRQGNVVISRMDPTMLSKIAAAGDGEFYSASIGNLGLNQLYNKLNKLDKAEIETRVYSEYDDQFHYFTAFALIILLIDLLILERKNPKMKNFSLFHK
jgi:Ca-activated chloride channel family protein